MTKNVQKKNRPEAATSGQQFHEPKKVHENDTVSLSRASDPVKWVPVGVFNDPLRRFPAMPIYEMSEETPEAWNAKVECLMRERGSENAC